MRARLLAAFSYLIVGCSEAGRFEGELGIERDAVLGPSASAPGDRAVVVIGNTVGDLASGTLVAPTLVATSRQLLFSLAQPQTKPFFFACSESAEGAEGFEVTRAQPAGEFSVLVEGRIVRVTRLFGSRALDLCENDVALVQLESAVTEVAPLPVRLDGPPLADEPGALVGWGMTEKSEDLQRGQGLTASSEPHAASIKTSAIGKSELAFQDRQIPLSEGMFVAGASGCHGDIGGPFLSASGAVVGVLSSIVLANPERVTDFPSRRDCFASPNVFFSLYAQRDWIREAFALAGETPWLEGLARPAVLGGDCDVDDECVSHLCARAQARGLCSQRCTDDDCPTGFQCLGSKEARLCLPERLAVTNERRDCAATPASSSRCGSWFAIGSLLAGIALGRKRHQRRLGAPPRSEQ